jgi:hypothetical protein
LGLAAELCGVAAERDLSATPLLHIHGAPAIGEPIDVAAVRADRNFNEANFDEQKQRGC